MLLERNNPRLRNYLKQPGIPAFPDNEEPDTFYITPESIIEIFSWGQKFFQANPLFAPIQGGATRALNILAATGMIGLDGKAPPRRKGGCRGCAQRKLWAVALQLGSYFQRITLKAVNDEHQRLVFVKSMREFLSKYLSVDRGKRLVLIAQGQRNKLKEIEL